MPLLGLGYGWCPSCGAEGVRRRKGKDECKNGHVYPSEQASQTQPTYQRVGGKAPMLPLTLAAILAAGLK